MGLDQYAYRVRSDAVVSDTEYNLETDGWDNDREIFYWRKNNALQGWMEKLYREKGGDKISFNCVPVRLTLEDLNRLENAIKNGAVTPTEGFFWGELYYDDEMKERDIEFINEARDILNNSKDAVYYYSWW